MSKPSSSNQPPDPGVDVCPGKDLSLPDDPSRYPTWTVLKNREIGVDLRKIDKEGKEWELSVTSGKAALDIKVSLGKLDETSPLQKIANDIAAYIHPFAAEQLLIFSPYWLDELKKQEEIIEHKKTTAPERFSRKLVLYRLTEICLAAIEMWSGNASLMEPSKLLLLRQRYRYLAWMAWDWEDPKIFPPTFKPAGIMPKYEYLMRQARREWGETLLEKSEQVELELSAGLPENENWDMDHEAELLIQSPGHAPWFFAVKEPGDVLFTDRLIRGWFLARDDLPGAARLIAELASKQPTEKQRRCISNVIKLIHPWIIAWFAITAVYLLFAAWQPSLLTTLLSLSTFTGLPAISTFDFLIVLFLVANVPVGFVGLYLLADLKRMASYLFALRVPAMGVVGILAIAGLADAYGEFSLNAWESPGIAYSLLVTSVIASLAYILFEALTRTRSKKVLIRVSLLWLYSWASTFWLALVSAMSLDKVGVSACQPVSTMDAICNRILSDGTYRIVLKRFIEMGDGSQLSIDYIFLVSGLALLVGVFTQIFWEDKVIAEPL